MGEQYVEDEKMVVDVRARKSTVGSNEGNSQAGGIQNFTVNQMGEGNSAQQRSRYEREDGGRKKEDKRRRREESKERDKNFTEALYFAPF
eukprot:747824-Hanusia_phi.AAC.1